MYRRKDTNTETDRKPNTDTETNIKTNTDTETADRIMAIMKEHPAITVKKIAQQLNLSIGGVRYHVNKMKKDGLVEHIGSSKKGTWLIKTRT